ncbi:MAG: hypothetical protein U1E52_11950 [Geminicoccaceae bacterium]
MTGIFVDSSAWYALLDRRDPGLAGSRPRSGAPGPARHLRLHPGQAHAGALPPGWPLAHRLGAGLRSRAISGLVRVLPADLDAAWELFTERRDQRLSVTDCTSFAVMTRLKLDTAIALDQDARAMGWTVPP